MPPSAPSTPTPTPHPPPTRTPFRRDTRSRRNWVARRTPHAEIGYLGGVGEGRWRGVAGAVVAAALVAATATACSDAEPPGCSGFAAEEGFRVLFDGTQDSLDQWQMAGPGGFELREDCSAATVGGMGLLWFPEEFGNYRLRLDWQMAGDDNSGVFVGFPNPADDPWTAVNQGYEIQIDVTDAPDRTTGAIYTFQGADVAARDDALAPPGEWNTYEIAVEGSTITVHLNEVLINEFESTDPARDLHSGHIGLQNHGDADEVRFRYVRIRELPESSS